MTDFLKSIHSLNLALTKTIPLKISIEEDTELVTDKFKSNMPMAFPGGGSFK